MVSAPLLQDSGPSVAVAYIGGPLCCAVPWMVSCAPSMDLQALKKPSLPPPLLDRALKDVLVKLRMLSSVRAARLGSETARLKPGSSPPRGSGKDVSAWLHRRYKAADNNYDRLLVIKEAQAVLREGLYSVERAHIRGTLEWKLALARDPRISVEVAVAWGVSSSYVRQLRADLRDGKLGRQERAA